MDRGIIQPKQPLSSDWATVALAATHIHGSSPSPSPSPSSGSNAARVGVGSGVRVGASAVSRMESLSSGSGSNQQESPQSMTSPSLATSDSPEMQLFAIAQLCEVSRNNTVSCVYRKEGYIMSNLNVLCLRVHYVRV
jgi:hypothetical protein